MRWFARHFLDHQVWRPTQATFAGGAAIGVFVSAQLMPGQILLGIILAALFRVNIPLVIVLSWISNPLTFFPIGVFEKEVGDWVLAWIGDSTPIDELHDGMPGTKRGLLIARSMYLGGVVSGLIGAPIAYAVGWFGWTGIARLLRIPLDRLKHPRHANLLARALQARQKMRPEPPSKIASDD